MQLGTKMSVTPKNVTAEFFKYSTFMKETVYIDNYHLLNLLHISELTPSLPRMMYFKEQDTRQ